MLPKKKKNEKRRRVKLTKQLKALVILLMHNRLKGKVGTCRTNNSISRLRFLLLEPTSADWEPLAKGAL
jgi:hypothetical protein